MALLSKLASYGAGLSFLLLALLSPRSRKARYYLNTLLYFGSMGISSVVGILISVVVSLIPGQRFNIQYFVARTMYLLAGNSLGIRFHIEGYENFAKNRPAVLVGNHQSSMDILYLGAVFPKQTSIMAKKELRWAPLLGQWMWLAGAVFVDRASKKDAFKTFDYVGERMRKDKLSLWIFPEGTRSKLPVPDLLPFKMGAFHLALQAKVPIVPVVCENYYRFHDGKTRFESATIRIKVLPPVDVSKYNKEMVHDLADHVRELMKKELQAMDADADQYDTESVVAAQPGSSLTTASNAVSAVAPRGAGLGGVARLASFFVGVGRGHDASKDVARAQKQLEKRGLPGAAGGTGLPSDFGLVSEEAKSKEAQGQAQGLTQRMARRSGSNSGSSEEGPDEDAIIVKRPAEAST
ncbi:acyltransferase [Tilletiaria anomala UBC 951]|uniref:1-acyl-sn-glycerol-3-phosphate acyltransferase n=1 Tax=Tilletiaria anomala (strain ATCC 24038 / CBS 436.72 / UBC 951) TaxID=1037660 RepID=A0A066W585_TILAU|nr:acyltransferase [Tilletiaria anomala UBC 951]KDN45925.1 acyltransferase [Tilletiaria anomala UBC 951]